MFLFSIIGLTGFHLYLLATTTMDTRPDSVDKYLYEEIKKKKEFEKNKIKTPIKLKVKEKKKRNKHNDENNNKSHNRDESD